MLILHTLLMFTIQTTPAPLIVGEASTTLPSSTLNQQDSWPDELPPALATALKTWGPWAADRELDAHASFLPGILLFTSTDEEDASRMVSALSAVRDAFPDKLTVHEENASPLIAFHFVDKDAYDSLIDEIVKQHAYLSGWASTGKSLNGFALYQPEVCAILENDLAPRDTSRDNLLVHQAALVTLFQQFGVQPYWVREGVALDLEATITNRLYAFGMSDGFVPQGRPKNWRKDIAKAWKRSKEDDVDRVFSMASDRYSRSASLRAMGLCRFLSKTSPDGFASALRELQSDREANLNQDPFFVSTEETQAQVFSRFFGDDWREKVVQGLKKAEKSSGKASVNRYGYETQDATKSPKRRSP